MAPRFLSSRASGLGKRTKLFLGNTSALGSPTRPFLVLALLLGVLATLLVSLALFLGCLALSLAPPFDSVSIRRHPDAPAITVLAAGPTPLLPAQRPTFDVRQQHVHHFPQGISVGFLATHQKSH